MSSHLPPPFSSARKTIKNNVQVVLRAEMDSKISQEPQSGEWRAGRIKAEETPIKKIKF